MFWSGKVPPAHPHHPSQSVWHVRKDAYFLVNISNYVTFVEMHEATYN